MTSRSNVLVELIQQDAVAVEQTALNGNKQVDVYVVIKNQPFNVSHSPPSNVLLLSSLLCLIALLSSLFYHLSRAVLSCSFAL
jgi:hypothetical protein